MEDLKIEAEKKVAALEKLHTEEEAVITHLSIIIIRKLRDSMMRLTLCTRALRRVTRNERSWLNKSLLSISRSNN